MTAVFTLLFAASIVLETAWASRCCQFLCSAEECNSSPYNCKWLESGVADELIVDGVQCRSHMWGECGDCCPACPGLGPGHIEHTCSSEATCPTEPPQPPATEAYGPMAVKQEIADSLDPGCKSPMTNCMEKPDYRGRDGMYMTSIISFQSLSFSEDFDACCYNFRSERNKDNTDCTGHNSAQKMLLIDVDCAREDFEIVETAANSNIDFSEVGDLCYTGIRIDSECDRVCDYEVCVKWKTLPAGQCPWATGWVMTQTKGAVISFGALDGVPSCYLEDQVMPVTSFKSMLSGIHGVSHLYNEPRLAITGLVICALAALYVVCHRRKKSADEEESLKSDRNDMKNTYMSTV